MSKTAKAFRYTYRASFADGTAFVQPDDDESVLRPGEKSATFDLLEHAKAKALVELTLSGGGRKVSVIFPGGRVVIDGREYVAGGWVPNGCGWVELLPDEHLHGPYFRRVQRTFQEGREVSVQTQFCIGIPGSKHYIGVI